MSAIKCPWCLRRHKPRYVCDPVQKVLDEMRRRGQAGDMPSLVFDEPIPADQLGLGAADDRLVGSWTVQAATGEVAGVIRPGLVFTGVDVYGRKLPQWIYFGSDENMDGLAALVTDMTGLAVRTAARARGEAP